MVISLGEPCGSTGYSVASVAALDFRPARRATCRERLPVRRGRIGDCCREDCPFHSAELSPGGIGHCCSRSPKRSPVWTVRANDRPFPCFHMAPCSVQLGLSSALRQRPSCTAKPCPIRYRNYCGRDMRPLLSSACSGAGIRTPTLRSKVCCPTVRRPRIARRELYYTRNRVPSQSR
jgi:hypothetical protein